jgi:hypothetical protein
MTLRHVFVSLAVTCLAACSSDDTIVSLNVTATDRVPVVETMKVTFKQGSRSYVYDFKPPTETSAAPDSVSSVKNSFFERITLPGDWDEAEATVAVEAFKVGGGSFSPALTDDTTVVIQPDGAAAAYVELDIPEAPPPPAEGGAGGEGGTPGEGGAPSNLGGAPTDAGGEANAGGTGGEDASNGGAGGVGGAD